MEKKILDSINQPNDIKKVRPDQYDRLAAEIREFLIEKVSVTGGHLASNLGTVELTMGLHLSLNLPQDKIIWDVGHQSYTHKILTGRRNQFDSLRQFEGLSGFPKRRESECDTFDTGHSSTSISAALGLACARDVKQENSTIVAVIGDGALTGGMAWEALNNAAKLESNLIIVLNDNKMSISPNVGGISSYLNDIRTSDNYLHVRDSVYYSLNGKNPRMASGIRRAKNSIKQLMIPGMYFEDLGITYLGPVDGHNVNAVVHAMRAAKRVHKCVLVHVITQKGKGYEPAEKHPSRFHGTGPFEIGTGLPKKKKVDADWTDVFSTCMVKLGQRNDRVCAITAAMADGTGLKRFRNIYPERFFDVGIAEQHAVTFAAGLSVGGLIPIVCVYSSFLQRAYDQIVHDVCLQNLHVIFAVDRAGLVGADGETHQGILDLSFLLSIPGMTVMAPKNKWELSDMLKYAVSTDGPIAVRYPRGRACDRFEEHREPIVMGKAEILREERGVLLLALGSMVETAAEVHDLLEAEGIPSSVVNARFAKPVDEELLISMADAHPLIVTLEENEESGGFGAAVLECAARRGISSRILTAAIPDEFVEQGPVDVLKKYIGLDASSLAERISREYRSLCGPDAERS